MSLGINTVPAPAVPIWSDLDTTGSAIDRPIFITGLGRSGTTVIHTLLSTHPNANWLSLLCGKFPDRPYLNRWLMRAIDVPILNLYLKYRFEPLENYDFWNLHFGGFFLP